MLLLLSSVSDDGEKLKCFVLLLLWVRQLMWVRDDGQSTIDRSSAMSTLDLCDQCSPIATNTLVCASVGASSLCIPGGTKLQLCLSHQISVFVHTLFQCNMLPIALNTSVTVRSLPSNFFNIINAI